MFTEIKHQMFGIRLGRDVSRVSHRRGCSGSQSGCLTSTWSPTLTQRRTPRRYGTPMYRWPRSRPKISADGGVA